MLNKCQLILATGGMVAQDLTMQWSTMGGFMQELSLLVIDEGQQYGTDREIAVISLLRQQPLVLWTGDSEQTPGSQRVNDLEAAIRQLRQIGCILDSCTISVSYEVTQAQKAILQLHHTAKGASTSSEELNAQISPRTDDEYNLPYHEDELQEH